MSKSADSLKTNQKMESIAKHEPIMCVSSLCFKKKKMYLSKGINAKILEK